MTDTLTKAKDLDAIGNAIRARCIEINVPEEDLRLFRSTMVFAHEVKMILPELIAECERQTSAAIQNQITAGLHYRRLQYWMSEAREWRKIAIEERAKDLAQYEMSADGWRSWEDFQLHSPKEAGRYREQAERELEAMR